MHMYNLIEYSGNYSKKSGSSWNYYRDYQFLDNGAAAYFPTDNNNCASFKFKGKIAGRTENDGTKNVKIRVPLKYLSSFGRNPETPLIDCEINFILTWSNSFIIDNPIHNQEPTFTITDTKLYVPVVTLSLKIMQNYLNN